MPRQAGSHTAIQQGPWHSFGNLPMALCQIASTGPIACRVQVGTANHVHCLQRPVPSARLVSRLFRGIVGQPSEAPTRHLWPPFPPQLVLVRRYLKRHIVSRLPRSIERQFAARTVVDAGMPRSCEALSEHATRPLYRRCTLPPLADRLITGAGRAAQTGHLVHMISSR